MIRPPGILVLILGYSSLLVLLIAVMRGHTARSLATYAIGLLVLLAAIAGVWLLDRRTRPPASTALSDRAIVVGLVLGLLWVVEIGINNFIAPPLPARDHIDDVFWAVIALAILFVSTHAAHRADRFGAGVMTGVWSGFASGAVACGMALSLIAFWMDALLRDPLNQAEWAARGTRSGAPNMAAYFAGETFAGALLHLVVLGIVMGGLLGAVGGAVGKGIRAVRPRTR